MKRMLVALIIVLALLSGCDRFARQQRKEEALARDIDAKMAEIIADAGNLGTAALDKYLDDGLGARFFYGGRVYSKGKLIEVISSSYAGLQSQKLLAIEPMTIVLGKNAVLWNAQVSSVGKDKEGNAVASSAAESWIWYRYYENDQEVWKVRHINSASQASDR